MCGGSTPLRAQRKRVFGDEHRFSECLLAFRMCGVYMVFEAKVPLSYVIFNVCESLSQCLAALPEHLWAVPLFVD
jgi:hypothetical protein